MDIPTNHQTLNFQFNNLLLDLAKTWWSDEIAFVRDLIEHGEPEQAFSNLLGIVRMRRKRLSAGQQEQVAALAAALRVTVPPMADAKLPLAQPA